MTKKLIIDKCKYCSSWFMKKTRTNAYHNGGFFTYIGLIIGTVLLLFWSAMSDEINVIVGITHDEIALTAINYRAEGIIGCLLREYSEKGDIMPVQHEVVYENEGVNTVTYILNRPGNYSNVGDFTVQYRNTVTGQRVSYSVRFSETPGPWPKSIKVERVSRLQ